MAKKQIGFADLRVGILVVIAITIIVIVILTISGDINPFRKQLIVRTRLANVDGLRSGAEVRLAGVKVGQVQKVILLEIPKSDESTQTVELELALDPFIDGKPTGERVRKDSKVILGSVGLLGDKVVDIIPGTTTAQAIHNGEEIQGLQETTIRQMISGADDILANFTTLSVSVKQIAEKVNRGEGTIGKLVSDDTLYSNLNQTVQESQKLVKDLRAGRGTIGQLINDPKLYNELDLMLQNVEKIVLEISEGKGTLGKLAKDEKVYTQLSDVIARIDSTTTKLEGIVSNVSNGQGNLGLLLKDEKLFHETEATIANLSRITERLDKGEGSAGKLINDSKLYENLNDASEQIAKLMYEFRNNPKKYLTVKLKLF